MKLKPSITLFASGALVALLHAGDAKGTQKELPTAVFSNTSKPNILFILADNWRWPTAGVLGDPMARTPTFDRIAHEGIVFTHTFNSSPSCSPSRASMLTGRYPHELGERASLWSAFPKDTPVVTQLLREAGYDIGYNGKAWGPGNVAVSGWQENPVGPKYTNFAAFLAHRKTPQPFFYWMGNTDTATRGHKLDYTAIATNAGLDPAKLVVPPGLPDCPEVRLDLLNYYGGVLKLDEEAARAIALLEKSGELDNTVVIYTGDNGWQMPRGLGNCYDMGSRVPLAIRWGKHFAAGRKLNDFINLGDLGPTFLELAGLTPPPVMTMHSIKNLLLGNPDSAQRESVFIERERHANVRTNNLSYPVRAVRTHDFLYLRNLRPDRWPAGDPDVFFIHGRPFGDVDTSRTKDFLLAHQNDPAYAKYIALIFGKRPAEELYDLRSDPTQLTNVASQPAYAGALKQLRARVDEWMKQTHDPRVDPAYDGFDTFPYYGKGTPHE